MQYGLHAALSFPPRLTDCSTDQDVSLIVGQVHLMSPSNEATLEARRAFCLSSGMLRTLPFVFLLLVSPAAAQDRFAPDNPWFREFDATCRAGRDMVEECKGSVLGAYAEYAGVDQSAVSCDFREFWRIRDARFRPEIINVLPWQYGVEAIVRTPGVCKPPVEAAREYRDGDNLLACLMGKATVELRHGASAETALKFVEQGCIDANPERDSSSNWLDEVWNKALLSLETLERAQVF
jgi:hypothetical protein